MTRPPNVIPDDSDDDDDEDRVARWAENLTPEEQAKIAASGLFELERGGLLM